MSDKIRLTSASSSGQGRRGGDDAVMHPHHFINESLLARRSFGRPPVERIRRRRPKHEVEARLGRHVKALERLLQKAHERVRQTVLRHQHDVEHPLRIAAETLEPAFRALPDIAFRQAEDFAGGLEAPVLIIRGLVRLSPNGLDQAPGKALPAEFEAMAPRGRFRTSTPKSASSPSIPVSPR